MVKPLFKGQIAARYDAWYSEKLGNFVDQVETDAALDLFYPRPGMTLLDAGCGTGNFSIKLARRGCQVMGIDISPDMLSIARHKAEQEHLPIEFLEMDLYDLHFADHSFDGVFTMAAWEFIKEEEKAFAELHRVLKPGGKLLIGTINLDSPWGSLYLDIARQDESSVFRYAHFKTMEDLRKLNPGELLDTRECLFIPPDAPEDMISLASEEQRKGREKPGFILAVWEKK